MRALSLPLGGDVTDSGIVRLPLVVADAERAWNRHYTKTVTSSVGTISPEGLVAVCMSEKVTKSPKAVSVSERNLQSAAVRLLPKHNRLVSTEVDYLRRVLGDRATQRDIDEKVMLVRRLPWSEIVGE
jgi:hypothetical protein